MKAIVTCFIAFLYPVLIQAKTLHIGTGQSYQTLSGAAADAMPGDSILFHAGVYAGGEFVGGLQGGEGRPIYIVVQAGAEVIIRGGTNSWQLSDAAYLHIEGFIFENQTGNGFNMDDGGDYTTPTHHITFRYCTFRDISASGNNDLLKLSGVDDFKILDCTFINGSPGGSGIDMVGCHQGEIVRNHFENMGSNAIQAKGGSRQITIEKNFFKNCGQRSLNLGGSTGLQYFRPIDATYEAAEIHVICNIFIGSVAPVAFVGCVRSAFVHNTIIRPEKWVLRILQETVDPERFEACGNNIFRNNLIYKNNSVSTDCNIGPDTAPETFIMSNNLWYNEQLPGNSTPVGIPVTDHDQITGHDPLLNDVDQEDLSIPASGPATGAGYPGISPDTDYIDHPYADPPSIGAFEGNPAISNVMADEAIFAPVIYPNPARQGVHIRWKDIPVQEAILEVTDIHGIRISREVITNDYLWQNTAHLTGLYFFRISVDGKQVGIKKVLLF